MNAVNSAQLFALVWTFTAVCQADGKNKLPLKSVWEFSGGTESKMMKKGQILSINMNHKCLFKTLLSESPVQSKCVWQYYIIPVIQKEISYLKFDHLSQGAVRFYR